MLLINIWQTYKKSNGATNLHEKINDQKTNTTVCQGQKVTSNNL